MPWAQSPSSPTPGWGARDSSQSLLQEPPACGSENPADVLANLTSTGTTSGGGEYPGASSLVMCWTMHSPGEPGLGCHRLGGPKLCSAPWNAAGETGDVGWWPQISFTCLMVPEAAAVIYQRPKRDDGQLIPLGLVGKVQAQPSTHHHTLLAPAALPGCLGSRIRCGFAILLLPAAGWMFHVHCVAVVRHLKTEHHWDLPITAHTQASCGCIPALQQSWECQESFQKWN